MANPLINRDVPIVWNLAATVVGALAVLAVVGWMALDRLESLVALQTAMSNRTAQARQLASGLLVAQDLRVVTRDLQHQPSVDAVKAVAERVAQLQAEAAGLLHHANGRIVELAARERLDDLELRFASLATAAGHVAALRTAVIDADQQRVLQARAPFDENAHILAGDLVRGSATQAASGWSEAQDALAAYRLALGRVQAGALMVMATGDVAAANAVFDATDDAARSMAKLLGGDLPDSVKADAQAADARGREVVEASLALVAQSLRLEHMAQTEMETASDALQSASKDTDRWLTSQDAVSSAAFVTASRLAVRDMTLAIGCAALLVVVLGGMVTWVIGGPIRDRTVRVSEAASVR
jgi:hypothetical protein